MLILKIEFAELKFWTKNEKGYKKGEIKLPEFELSPATDNSSRASRSNMKTFFQKTDKNVLKICRSCERPKPNFCNSVLMHTLCR